MSATKPNGIVARIADRWDDRNASDLQIMALILCLVLMLAGTLIALIGLIAWHWWLGLPVAGFVVYRLFRFALRETA